MYTNPQQWTQNPSKCLYTCGVSVWEAADRPVHMIGHTLLLENLKMDNENCWPIAEMASYSVYGMQGKFEKHAKNLGFGNG